MAYYVGVDDGCRLVKLTVERSETTGDWWVRCVARNGRIVGTSQEGYRNKGHAVRMAERLALKSTSPRWFIECGGWNVDVVSARRIVRLGPFYRWHLVASNGRKVFGSHEVLTKRAHAERMAYRVLTEAHELEVRG